MSDAKITATPKAELLQRIERAWERLHAYLRTLTTDQLTQTRDANGWAVKDFMIHLATWEKGVTSALNKHSYAEGLGVDKADFDKGVEHINTVLHKRYHHLTLDEALEMSRQSHEYLLAALNTLSDDDLKRPIREFDPSSARDRPLIDYVAGDSYEHYEEHLKWLTELMTSSKEQG